MHVQLTPVQRAQAQPAHGEAPYRLFLGVSLVLALGGGFALAIAVALAGAYEWDWGTRQASLAQAHGQLQLLGFGGLFTAGMACRLMPRFSGRPLAFARVVPWIALFVASSLVLRAAAQPAADSAARDVLLLLSAALLACGATALAAVVGGTLLHRESKAEATGYFFVAGALAFLAAAALNAEITLEMVREGNATAAAAKQQALVVLEQYGFLLSFLGGVATRAVPTLTGRPRPDVSARLAALALAAGVAMFAAGALWGAYRSPFAAPARVADAGLLIAAAAFFAIAWLGGALRPAANRVAAASQAPFWFVRSAFVWMCIAAALLAWYGVRGVADGAMPQAFALDAVRHALAVGVLTMMILGMGMLIVPEFAGRRLQHPGEAPLIIAMVVAANAATALRVWPSLEGIDWLEPTRYWPMVASGVLSSAAVAFFALMFAQSWREQRAPGWATPEALAGRRGGS